MMSLSTTSVSDSDLLNLSDLTVGYGKSPIISGINLKLNKGDFVGLIGPNGSGKSTLIRTLAGLIEPLSGEIRLAGASLRQFKRRDIARLISLIPQQTQIQDRFSVREIVAMGRNPYLGAFKPETEIDQQAVIEALEAADMLSLSDRLVNTLSGGEQQRVFIARALAQQAPLLLADEPISSLDISHQLEILSLFKKLTRDQNNSETGDKTVIQKDNKSCLCAIHDLNLAARFCDRLILVADNKMVMEGSPENVLTSENLARYFSVDANISMNDQGRISIYPKSPLPLS